MRPRVTPRVRPASCLFFFTDTATTEIYTLSLHDALPIWQREAGGRRQLGLEAANLDQVHQRGEEGGGDGQRAEDQEPDVDGDPQTDEHGPIGGRLGGENRRGGHRPHPANEWAAEKDEPAGA